MKNIEGEVFVVDNNSVDGSCDMIRQKFPKVRLIRNTQNLGFSKANNLAIRESKGKYILLLNPDTVVEESSFSKCIDFMEKNPKAGGLGVKMIDGTGYFLPESKRALPTPLVAFFKVFGLSSLFPRSKTFGKYHLSYLDKNKTHDVDILAGAFMFLRKKALDKTGLLDEDFFMYGEDIDLSYRIQEAGYRNYYFPETTIIHYKGESTKKGSINYVLVFYRAMIIFAKKHFSRKNARVFSFLINMAIYFRAALAIFRRTFKRIYQPLIDGILFFGGFYFLTPVWEQIMFANKNYYPPEYIKYIVPSYILVWLFSLYYSGAYEKPVKIWNIFKGHLTGTLVILVLYALLPEHLRFSRALLLLGSAWILVALIIHRIGLNISGLQDYEFAANRKKRMIIIGEKDEAERVRSILLKTKIRPEIAGIVNPDTKEEQGYIGNLSQMEEMVEVHKIEEIVFCAGNISSTEIIRQMAALINQSVEYKIAPPESLSVIGSNSINTAGELYMIQFNSIAKGKNKRNKRLLDILSSLFFIILSPVLIFFFKNYIFFLKNSFSVLFGFKTWVGYDKSTDISDLPNLKKAVILVSEEFDEKANRELIENINLEYARDYKIANDLNLIWKKLTRNH